MNLQLGSDTKGFPTSEDYASPFSVRDATELVENSYVMFDDESLMTIHGVGVYKGPVAIGSYRAVPHSNASYGIVYTGNRTINSIKAEPARMNIKFSSTHQAYWTVYNNKWRKCDKECSKRRDFVSNINTTHGPYPMTIPDWVMDYEYFPCSAMRKSEYVIPHDLTNQGFTDSARDPAEIRRACTRMLGFCQGKNAQYETVEECENHWNSLPMHDPVCQKRDGPVTWQGNSRICK